MANSDLNLHEGDPEINPSSSELKSSNKQTNLSQSDPLSPLDGPAAFKELKRQQIAEALSSIRVGLEEDRLNPTLNAPPWLQILSNLSDTSGSRCEPNFPQNKAAPVFEHHIRPPQYTWCGLLDRNAYPKRDNIRSHESNELTAIRFVPYFEAYDKQSPAEKLKELEETASTEKYEICLTDRICPDVLRQNFYELVEAFNLPSNECLLGIMSPLPPNGITEPPSDDQLIQSLALKISGNDEAKFSRLYDLYSRDWTRLKRSSRLKNTPIPLRIISSEFSIAEIIDSFRLTLPANKRIFKTSASDSSNWSKLCHICQQFYCEGHYDQRVPGKPRHHSPNWRSPSPDRYLNALPVDTGGYVPCSHSGKCFANQDCDCYKLTTYCDRFCQCAESCPRRYQGCRCRRICDEDCECVQRNRECDPLLCKCPTCKPTNPCSNFMFAKKKKRTFVAPSKISGFGLFAGEAISMGDYIGEYTGVLLRSDELAKQSMLTSLSKSSYLFDLNQFDTVDSGKFGNRTRFINEPINKRYNADPCVWYVAGTQVLRIFASKKIRVGEEITINYGESYHARDWS
ncbi:hypothetical protein PGT21_034391 [Puccinia graminis f. sp. tritici]|uniref:SET domain-containing protein n=1 Tax=Puccinia graminis f. sp. tritici TaxID=56615 RepID=A0A5B0LMX6_PUCGR|nr:hypothetical protein PGTUg99_021042 [Puccinia graminis f. sp. tritici]KAA1095002.1 hypothetical protein PGT21_034391 [Puccinia graminis f. sp. tritici]